MVRIIGVDLPRQKKITYALTYIYGIGLTSAKKIVNSAKINPEKRIFNLTNKEITILRRILETFDLKLEGNLRRFNGLNLKHLNEINCYRGNRHRNKLPTRGQRTRTNARIQRSSKKKVRKKKN